MNEHVYKTLELVGSSESGADDAVRIDAFALQNRGARGPQTALHDQAFQDQPVQSMLFIAYGSRDGVLLLTKMGSKLY